MQFTTVVHESITCAGVSVAATRLPSYKNRTEPGAFPWRSQYASMSFFRGVDRLILKKTSLWSWIRISWLLQSPFENAIRSTYTANNFQVNVLACSVVSVFLVDLLVAFHALWNKKRNKRPRNDSVQFEWWIFSAAPVSQRRFLQLIYLTTGSKYRTRWRWQLWSF